MMDKKSPLNMVACILLVVGGLNWGLTGLGMLINYPLNVVNLIFGSIPVLEAIIYLLVGVSAVVHLMTCGKECKTSEK